MSETGSGLDLAGKAAGSRRLIAIVYADMVGYSRLIGFDDAGTLRRLRTLRRALIDPAIREFGGRVVQTGGDSLLIAFDSIDGAVRCAVKVQQQMPVYDGDQPADRRIRFRIGINIGDVIPDGTDLHGDGVNVAARLQAECPPGGICVSRSIRDHVHGRLDLPFEAMGPLTLKNIARPVEGFVLRLDPAARAPVPATARMRGTRLRAPLLAGVAVLLLGVAGGATWWFHRAPREHSAPVASTSIPAQPVPPIDVGLARAPRLSIIVLPFANLSGDPKDDYLAEGITDDITTDLSRVTGMFVIARESAYSYQGKAIDVRKIGDELGVRYVLEGSVRKLGDVLHVNAQLVSTETGAHLWADRFDQKLDDLSAGQEEIVDRIGHTLNIALIDLESARSKRERPTNPDAFDLILRARSLGSHPMSPEEHADRIRLFEAALRLDPRSVNAMTGLADELDRRGDRERAAKLLADAAAIRPNDPHVLASSALLLFNNARYSEAIAAYHRLLDEDPNAHYAYNLIGWSLIYSGRFAEAVPMLETAVRHDPRNPFNYTRYEGLGIALGAQGKYDESIVWTERALAAAPAGYTRLRAQYNLRIAAASALLGRLEEAHRAVAEADRMWPYDTVRIHFPTDPSSRWWLRVTEQYQMALRLAGHRDHAEEDADFGVPTDVSLRDDYAGLTPTTVPGATTIRTTELARLLDERKPIVIDPLLYFWGPSIPGAIGLKNAGRGGTTSDAVQERLRKKMQALTSGDLGRPIVAVGWNSERFDGRNLALRLVALGYTNVYWYRGGREAWEVAGLPETQVDVQDW
ncbi:MAG TPA: tetratricopeptide repeat protein [Acetobacteraceae bacterium]